MIDFERYLPIPGFVGFYDVSAAGVVRSLGYMRAGRYRRKLEPQVMRTHMRHGYVQVTLSRPGRRSNEPGGRYKVGVHRLVALAHIDPFPDDDLVVAHLDGDRTNNHVSNLEFCTQSQNCQHKIEHGTIVDGDDHHNATPLEVCIEILRRVERGDRRTVVARELGVSKGIIYRVTRQQTANAREAAWIVGEELGMPSPLIPGMIFGTYK